MNKKITFVEAEDWEGIYIDGKLAMQTHALWPQDILSILGIKYEVLDANEDWIQDVGKLPENLSECKFENQSENQSIWPKMS